MATTILTDAEMIEVKRSELQQNQSELLRRARGKTMLLIKSNNAAQEKVVMDKQYFDQIRRNLEALVETLEIAMDRKLFTRILGERIAPRAGETN